MARFYIFYICVLIGALAAVPVLAQVHPGNNLYTQNMFTQNASFASSGEVVRAALQSTRILGEEGSNFSVSRFTIQGKLKDSFGVGARVLLASQGPYSNLLADLVSSYEVNFTENQSLQAGISFGFARNSAFLSSFSFNEFANREDPMLSGNGDSFVDPLIGVGFNYTFKSLQVAASLPSLASGRESFLEQYMGVASYEFDSVQKLPLQLKPLVSLAKLPYSKPYADFNVQATWDDCFWVQPGYRTTGTFMTSVGMKWNEFDFGYGFGIPFGRNTFLNRSVHEVLVSFRIL